MLKILIYITFTLQQNTRENGHILGLECEGADAGS